MYYIVVVVGILAGLVVVVGKGVVAFAKVVMIVMTMALVKNSNEQW